MTLAAGALEGEVVFSTHLAKGARNVWAARLVWTWRGALLRAAMAVSPGREPECSWALFQKAKHTTGLMDAGAACQESVLAELLELEGADPLEAVTLASSLLAHAEAMVAEAVALGLAWARECKRDRGAEAKFAERLARPRTLEAGLLR